MTDGVRASATRALPGPDRLAMDRRHPVRTRTVAVLQVKRRGYLPLPRSAIHSMRAASLLNADPTGADRLGPLADLALDEAGQVVRAAPIRGDQHGT